MEAVIWKAKKEMEKKILYLTLGKSVVRMGGGSGRLIIVSSIGLVR